MQEVKQTIQSAVKELFDIEFEPELTRPEEQFGDYATNIAMHLAPKLSKTPKEIADALQANISNLGYYEKVAVAGPGFLNITLKNTDIWKMAANASQLPRPLDGQEILVEFGDPNPFKEMHIGHLYSYIVGDSISRLFEAGGASVKRLSYHGDVGLHVAKAIWGMQKSSINPNTINDYSKVTMGLYYARGDEAYRNDEGGAKEEIHSINEYINSNKSNRPEINEIYEWGREISLSNFHLILKDIGVERDGEEPIKQYFESQTKDIGTKFVKENLGRVFKESEGAIIYDGEKIGLHTRVFITSKGQPTYETKDLGLAELKNEHYPKANRSIIITANEQSEYFKVMLAALKDIDFGLASKTTHLSHGFVSLTTGKMSSRTGNVYSGIAAIVDIDMKIEQLFPNTLISQATKNAAMKYGFLKHRLGSDIVYDLAESFSVQGNSGPYLQYAYARANGILQKINIQENVEELEPAERSLGRKISEYPEVVAKATAELMPHYIATYLYELAQIFNRFYENNRVAGDPREGTRGALVKAYASTLKGGLSLLNIEAPDRI